VTVGFALAFFAAAALAWVTTDTSWLAVHFFLAGGVVLAISGVSLMLTVTWSAAPAPADRIVGLQRLCVAAGAGGVAAARRLELGSAVLDVAGVTYVAGLVLLAVLLVTTVRRGVERRFDAAVVSYVAALSAGTVGVAVGVVMAVHGPSLRLRAAHVTLNLLGLVGLVVAGTLPFFAATVGRSRMAPRASARRLMAAVAWQAVALALAVAGLAGGADALATVGLVAYAGGIGAVLWLAPRPTRRQLRWAGPRVLALWAGAGWWAVAVAAAAVAVQAGDMPLTGPWLSVLVVAGYGQILWGSLAYLLPMLRGGGHERLGEGFAATRSWVGFGAANVAGIAFVASSSALAALAVGAWVVDAAARAARVGFGRRATRPVHEGPSPVAHPREHETDGCAHQHDDEDRPVADGHPPGTGAPHPGAVQEEHEGDGRGDTAGRGEDR
jgi:nitrite reductase (NO-forming)